MSEPRKTCAADALSLCGSWASCFRGHSDVYLSFYTAECDRLSPTKATASHRNMMVCHCDIAVLLANCPDTQYDRLSVCLWRGALWLSALVFQPSVVLHAVRSAITATAELLVLTVVKQNYWITLVVHLLKPSPRRQKIRGGFFTAVEKLALWTSALNPNGDNLAFISNISNLVDLPRPYWSYFHHL